MSGLRDPVDGHPVLVVSAPPPVPFKRDRPEKPVTQVNKPVQKTDQDLEEIYAPRKSKRAKKGSVPSKDYYPIVADQPGMYQMDVMKVSPNFGGFIGMVVLVFINKKLPGQNPSNR